MSAWRCLGLPPITSVNGTPVPVVHSRGPVETWQVAAAQAGRIAVTSAPIGAEQLPLHASPGRSTSGRSPAGRGGTSVSRGRSTERAGDEAPPPAVLNAASRTRRGGSRPLRTNEGQRRRCCPDRRCSPRRCSEDRTRQARQLAIPRSLVRIQASPYTRAPLIHECGAYSRSPAASRASDRSVNSSMRTILPSRTV